MTELQLLQALQQQLGPGAHPSLTQQHFQISSNNTQLIYNQHHQPLNTNNLGGSGVAATQNASGMYSWPGVMDFLREQERRV
jgi:hypothetical protein